MGQLEARDDAKGGRAELLVAADPRAELDAEPHPFRDRPLEPAREEPFDLGARGAEEGAERGGSPDLGPEDGRPALDAPEGQPRAGGEPEEQLGSAGAARRGRVVERADVDADLS